MKEVLNVCHLLPRSGAVSTQYEEENAIGSSIHRKHRIGGQALPVLFLNNACVVCLPQHALSLSFLREGAVSPHAK